MNIPQQIPVLRDALNDAILAIGAQLDAIVASRSITRPQLSLLPSAADFAAVDLAVRQWATLRGAKIDEGEPREHSEMKRNGRAVVVHVYCVKLGGESIVAVHRPDEPLEVAPPHAVDDQNRTDADVSGMWLP
jgi:hypothetical protein